MRATEATTPPGAADARVDSTSMTRIAVSSVIGTSVEWYDLYLFATASALVFNKVFFPDFDPAVGTMLAFGTFAAAYVARILGAMIFGHFGDRIGRKSMLLISLLGMGAATFLIGCLPNYYQIGIWAPILLLTLRIMQGLALGGEWGGAVLMTVEHAPEHKRGFFGSWVQIGVPMGTLLANGVFLIIAGMMPEEQLVEWGWRIPFLASIILIAIGLYIRLTMEETPAFQKVKEEGAKAKIPLAELLRKYWKQVILGGLATVSTGTSFNLLVGSGINYGTKDLGFTKPEMLMAVMIACAVCVILLPIFGALSDRVGRKPIIIAGIVAEAVVAFPMFFLMDQKVLGLVVAAYLLMMTAFAANYGPIATFLAELFGAKVRYSGLSIAYMLSGLIGSAATPAVTTWLFSLTGNGSSVAWYMIISAIVSLVCLLLLTETRYGDIDAVDAPPAEAARAEVR